jgi:putative ABC transport system ATP-binding protein
MNQSNQPLIQMEKVTKVFFAEEVETHALSNVHLKIGVGEYVDSWSVGLRKSTLLSLLGLLDSPTEGSYLERQARGKLETPGTGANSKPGNRIHLQSFNLIGISRFTRTSSLPIAHEGCGAQGSCARIPGEKVGMAHRARTCPASFPGQQRASQWREPWQENRSCCWPTSRPGI